MHFNELKHIPSTLIFSHSLTILVKNGNKIAQEPVGS